MDKWKKYITDNDDNLSIEDVDDKIWENVYKAAVPKKRLFITNIKTGLAIIKKYKIKNESHTTVFWNHRAKLAYAFIFLAFVIVSCTYKVQSSSRYGDMVTFAVTKKNYLLEYQAYSDSIFNSFSRIANPSDSSSFLFLKLIKENNRQTKGMISNIKEIAGVSQLAVTPVMFEFKESLLSSMLHKAFEIQLNEAKPDQKEIKEKIKGILKEKGLNSVNVQIDERNENVSFSSTNVEFKEFIDTDHDSSAVLKSRNDQLRDDNNIDTTPKINKGLETENTDLTKGDQPQWKKGLALMTQLTQALEKEGIVDNKKAYKLEIRDGELLIDGIKQPKAITDKVRKYMANDNYTVINNEDGPAARPNSYNIPKDNLKIGPTPNIDRSNIGLSQTMDDNEKLDRLIRGLVKDKLIDREKPYTIEIKEGQLYIDKKKQPQEVSDKYRKYFMSNNYGISND